MKTTDWKDELKKKWYLHTRKEGQQPYKADLSFTTCEEEVIEFIESLLKKQREKYYYEIENSTGTKEADYIDKQVNGGSESKLKLVLTIRQ